MERKGVSIGLLTNHIQKYEGTGIYRKKKLCKDFFKICLSLSFHNYKIVQISYPLQVDGAKENKSAPGDHEFSVKFFICRLTLERCPCAFFSTN